MAKKERAKLVKCKVIRNGFVVDGEELELGTELEMTEEQALRFTGKLELVSVIKEREANEAKTLSGFKGLQKENDALIAEAESMEERNSDLESQLKEALAIVAKATPKKKGK